MAAKRRTVRVESTGQLGASSSFFIRNAQVLETVGKEKWLYTVDLFFREGRIDALRIEPANEAAERVGISKTGVLRNVPVDGIVTELRRAIAKELANWSEEPRGVSTAAGEPLGTMSIRLSDELAELMRAVAAPVVRRPTRARGRQPLTDRDLAQEMQDYLTAVTLGVTVTSWLKGRHLPRDTFEKHRSAAVDRGLFIRSGKKGRPGGELTAAGRAALTQED